MIGSMPDPEMVRALTPLVVGVLTVGGTLGGVALGSWLAERREERHREERQRASRSTALWPLCLLYGDVQGVRRVLMAGLLIESEGKANRFASVTRYAYRLREQHEKHLTEALQAVAEHDPFAASEATSLYRSYSQIVETDFRQFEGDPAKLEHRLTHDVSTLLRLEKALEDVMHAVADSTGKAPDLAAWLRKFKTDTEDDEAERIEAIKAHILAQFPEIERPESPDRP